MTLTGQLTIWWMAMINYLRNGRMDMFCYGLMYAMGKDLR